ncbi:MAG: ABC transporter ATP-binding protein [Planctomycetes bacterium]|nr:ABC transporter ATP-binding protein [Planctomycetota bacterium]
MGQAGLGGAAGEEESLVEREAFARAWRFLSYKTVAKWSALTAAVLTGILYVAFLILLWLFADLLVNRGRIPSFYELPPSAQDDFLDTWGELTPQERSERLQDLGADPRAFGLGAPAPKQLPPAMRELIWRAQVHWLLNERVGPDAAALVTTNLDEPFADHGILSLVIRDRNYLSGKGAAVLARWFPWTWEPFINVHNFFVYLNTLLITGVLLALLRALVMFANDYWAALAVIDATTRLRRAVYHHTYRLGTLAFRSLGPGEAVSIFARQMEALYEGLYTGLTVTVREPVKFGLLLIFALLVNWSLTLVFLAIAILVWWLAQQLSGYFHQRDQEARGRAAEHLALLQESLMMMRLVKTFLMEPFNQNRVDQQLTQHNAALATRSRLEAIRQPALIVVGTLGGLLLLYTAGLIVVSGYLRPAGAITLAAALASLYWPVLSWWEHRRALQRGQAAALVIFKFLDRPGQVGQVVGAEFLPPLSQQLEFDKVSLKEPGTGRKLLDEVSFVVKAGERVGLVGPEDEEKHAVVYLIPRFLDPTSGEIRIDKRNLRWVTLESLRAQTAMVMQHSLTFNDTVANNIGCGDPSYNLPKIIEAAKIAHAHNFIQKLPKGYETPIGELGHSLNTSEQFRVALARAILRDPAILIIEEPLAPLDDDSKAQVDDTFARVLPGRTVIFLPHRVSTTRSCDQIFLLHKGRIEAAGEHRELLASSQLYRHLQYLEFNEFADQV